MRLLYTARQTDRKDYRRQTNPLVKVNPRLTDLGNISAPAEGGTEQMYGRILQMFSYKDKNSAIELYYKCGRRVAPLINELGYSDRHTSVQLGQRL